MLDKIWQWMKKNWLVLLTALAGIFAYMGLKDKFKKKEIIDDLENQTKISVEEADKKAKKDFLDAIVVAQTKKNKDDTVVTEAAKTATSDLNQEVKEKIEKDVEEDVDKAASDFAEDMGGKSGK